MADPIPNWEIEGDYLENCNCAVLCPCVVGPRTPSGGPLAMPTEGHCDVPMVFRIDKGHYGNVLLDGMHAGLAIYTPGPMGAGNWTFALYVDESANAAQHEALENIFGGAAGGPFGRLEAAVSTRLPVKSAPIRFEADGRKRRGEIPGVLEIEIEGIEGPDGGESWLDNVKHVVATRLAIAKSSKGFYRDHDFDWNNAERNGHYARFSWQGP